MHRELARCAACPEDQHCLAGPEVAAVVGRHPAGHPGHPEGGGEAGVEAGLDRKGGRVRDRHQVGQRAVRGGRAGQVAACAVVGLHDRFPAGDAGGWSRRNGNWSFVIATSSGFKGRATESLGAGWVRRRHRVTVIRATGAPPR